MVAYSSNPIPLESRLSYRCSMVAARIARFLAPMWESRYGLNVGAWRIMAIIARYEPLSAKDIATRTSNDIYHTSRAIDLLVRKKYIRRDVDPKDRRRAKIQLTASGRSTHQEIERILSRVENDLLAEVKTAERQKILDALANLDERVAALLASELTWEDFI